MILRWAENRLETLPCLANLHESLVGSITMYWYTDPGEGKMFIILDDLGTVHYCQCLTKYAKYTF